MNLRPYFGLIFNVLIFALASSCTTPNEVKTVPIGIIPMPAEMNPGDGAFAFTSSTTITIPEGNAAIKKIAEFLKEDFKRAAGFDLEIIEGDEGDITFFLADISHDDGTGESYVLDVSKKKIRLSASSPNGLFYAYQSLRQLLPVALMGKGQTAEWAVPAVSIKDGPRFPYRGMHLDVGRHIFPVEFVKKYIDLLAIHKMNKFHWHLTEDQGWRIEIKKYPKLTEVGAYRKETVVGNNSNEYDGIPYGGFYTQDEVREIVAYAAERFITVIPEIELPGHSRAALAAYPELGCIEGEEYEVATRWGVYEDIFCPTEETFKFLENVLSEVIELFPSEYIHIGGDEAPKTQWETSEVAQDLIKSEELLDEHGLQSYFITRMEKFINSKGRQIIGWDEILEGGLAPNATVMSWRGIEGGVEAAKSKHDVVMTPVQFCYFDYYQSDSPGEPLAIGGYLPLEKVYSYEPIPDELTAEEHKYIKGAQGNLWTEYIKTPEYAEYMAFPRAIALAEVVWSNPDRKDYTDFIDRLKTHSKRLDFMNVNYATHFYDVAINIHSNENKVEVSLESADDNAKIRYTLDGSEPNASSTLYAGDFELNETTTITARPFVNGKTLGRISSRVVIIHKAVGKSLTWNVPPHATYALGGKSALVNGQPASEVKFGDGEWLGWNGEDVEITIDLGSVHEISSIATGFFNGERQWVYLPQEVRMSLSTDGALFDEVGSQVFNENYKNGTIHTLAEFETKKARYVRLRMTRYGIIPTGRNGEGEEAWLFVDEIVVR